MPTPREPAAPASPPPPALPPDPPPGPPIATLPGNVTAAAILLLIFGTLAGIGTAMSLLAAIAFSARRFMPFDGFNGFSDFERFGGGGMFVVGFTPVLVTLVLGAAVTAGHIAAGAGILQRMTWGRILGMVVSAVALVVLVLGVAGTLTWVAILPDFRELDRIPEWFTTWFRSAMTAGVTIGVLVSLAAGAAYAYVLVVLARSDEVFD